MKILLLLALSLPLCAQVESHGLTGAQAYGCVGNPGNTVGGYRTQCQVTSTAVLYACNNAAGCTVAADWAIVGTAGTVSSVGLSLPPSLLNVTISPITGSGTLTAAFATGQTANRVFGTDGSGNVGLMSLATAQLPANVVFASSPGAGMARFAGSTQTVTSAELSGDATTSGSNVVTVKPGTLISTSGPVTDPGGSSAFQFNNASGALTFNLPAGVVGYQRCYRNATGKTGVITIAVTTSNTIDLNGANGTTTTGTLVSGGALGDAVCLNSDATNHWYAWVNRGTWTNN